MSATDFNSFDSFMPWRQHDGRIPTTEECERAVEEKAFKLGLITGDRNPELRVIGCILLDPDKCVEITREFMYPELFALHRGRELYGAILEMWKSNKSIDIITLRQHLKDKGSAYSDIEFLAGLPDGVASSKDIYQYLKEFWMRESDNGWISKHLRRFIFDESISAKERTDRLNLFLRCFTSFLGELKVNQP